MADFVFKLRSDEENREIQREWTKKNGRDARLKEMVKDGWFDDPDKWRLRAGGQRHGLHRVKETTKEK